MRSGSANSPISIASRTRLTTADETRYVERLGYPHPLRPQSGLQPISYQRGAVWPHDNGIIALGFKRYGFATEVARIARDISCAASYFVSYQLPELYAGIEHKEGTFPVQYPGANVPQAWAAGSVFHLLRAILGLHADAPNDRLYVDPALPAWLPELTLRRLAVGKAKVDLRFWLEGETTRWEASVEQGSLQVQKKPWGPWP